MNKVEKKQSVEAAVQSAVDNSGRINKDKLRSIIKTQIGKSQSSSFVQSLKDIPWSLPILIFIIYVVFFVVNRIESGIGNTLINVLILVGCVLAVVSTIIISLISTNNSMRDSNEQALAEVKQVIRSKVQSVMDQQCENCVRTMQNDSLNSYNLYTYEQILQIEQSLSGKEAAVYCYSRYRDDGDEVGIPEAEVIVDNNLSKGINYYYVYFEENPRAKKVLSIEDAPTALDDSKNMGTEFFINLSQKHGYEYIEECLDFRAYKDARFDAMIYYWGPEHIEGYYVLSFPIDTLCDSCDKFTSQNCPFCGAFNDTSKLLYKKMPQDIANLLYRRLYECANEN